MSWCLRWIDAGGWWVACRFGAFACFSLQSESRKEPPILLLCISLADRLYSLPLDAVVLILFERATIVVVCIPPVTKHLPRLSILSVFMTDRPRRINALKNARCFILLNAKLTVTGLRERQTNCPASPQPSSCQLIPAQLVLL